MKKSESIVKIASALLNAQKKIGAAKKDAENPFFHSKYADLGAVMEACKDPLNAEGITVLQPAMGNVVETILLHESGEWISSETPIVSKQTRTTKPNGEIVEVIADPQATGSAISYARRYGLQSMMFIPAEDDDANRAQGNSQGGTQTSVKQPKNESEDYQEDFPTDEEDSTSTHCSIHNKEMKERWNKDHNASWYDHRWMENGVWKQCNGKITK